VLEISKHKTKKQKTIKGKSEGKYIEAEFVSIEEFFKGLLFRNTTQ
jgi:hypothetical protein